MGEKGTLQYGRKSRLHHFVGAVEQWIQEQAPANVVYLQNGNGFVTLLRFRR